MATSKPDVQALTEPSGWPENDDTFTEQPSLWHVQYADDSRDCDGTYPLEAFYVLARCEDDAHNRAEEDFDTSCGVSITRQYDTRPATVDETAAWLKETFSATLSALSGETETEWEYALRAGDGTIFQPEGQKRPIGREVQVRRRPAGEWEVVV